MKNISKMLTIAALVVGLGGFAFAFAPSTPSSSVPRGWTFSFPDGDQKTGKELFVKMECFSCHTIRLPKETLVARPGSGNVGPELTGYAVLPKEYLASSIIKAHTVVAAPGYTVKDGKAAMGNYNHFLTVQELIDLVAFLKHGATALAK